MGGGSYSTNNRVNAAAAAAAAARAEEEVVSLASPFETEDPFVSTVDQAETIAAAPQASIADLYNNWLLNTEQGQRSLITGYTPPVEVPASASGTNAATIESIPPEQLARLQEMDLSFGNDILGLDAGNIAESVSMFNRENQYENITKYNPVGTAPEDMVVYDNLNSSEAKAAKAAREKEVAGLLQEWTQPLKELATTNPEQFEQEYNQLPTDARLSYLRNEYDQGSLTEREYQDAFAEQWNNSEKKEIGVLQFIEKYGYRMNSPDAIAQQGGQDQQGARDWYEADKVFGGDKGEGGDYSYLGSFTPTVKETFDPTSFGRALEASGPFRAALSIMTSGISEGVIAATKGLTGDTLHALDWYSIAMAGMQLMPEDMGGMTEAEAMEAGNEAVYAAQDAAIKAGNEAVYAAQDAAEAAGTTFTITDANAVYNEATGAIFTMADADAVYTAAYSKARGLEVLGMNLGDIRDLVIKDGGQPPSESDLLIKDAVQSVEDTAAGVGDGIIVNLRKAAEDALTAGTDINTVLRTIDSVVTSIQLMEEADSPASAYEDVINQAVEDMNVTGVTPDIPETGVDLEQPELDREPIEAKKPEADEIEKPELEKPPEAVVTAQIPSASNGGGGGGADTGGGVTGAGSSGTGVPEEGSGIPGTSGSGGLAQEEGYDPDVIDTMRVPNPDFDPESRDGAVLKQIYDIILKETDPVLRERLEQEYEKLGGNHLEEARANVPREEVYADYPPEYIEVPYEEATLDPETFQARYPDGWLGGSFDNIDANKDGVLSETEMYDYEHNKGSGQGGEPSDIVRKILDDLRLEVDTPDPSTGLPTDTTVETGTDGSPTDPAVGTGQAPSADPSTGIPSDTEATEGTTGAGGAGVGTDEGGGAGDGTTGGGAGSGEAEAGAGAGEGEGTGEGSGTGDGSGTGTGTGEGSGDGAGTGSGTGRGTGIGVGSATRTTDSLFKDMLQLETQIGSTQELLPFSVMPVPTKAVYKVPQANPIQQFLQQQEMQRIRSLPQGMLTNDELLKRFPY